MMIFSLEGLGWGLFTVVFPMSLTDITIGAWSGYAVAYSSLRQRLLLELLYTRNLLQDGHRALALPMLTVFSRRLVRWRSADEDILNNVFERSGIHTNRRADRTQP
jgi:hypothetical protein